MVINKLLQYIQPIPFHTIAFFLIIDHSHFYGDVAITVCTFLQNDGIEKENSKPKLTTTSALAFLGTGLLHIGQEAVVVLHRLGS